MTGTATGPAAPRRSGILLHPSSLPGPWGVGDLGPAAREFLDWLRAAGQSVWVLLPLGPVDETGSPYASPSAFAGNPLLLSVDDLVAEGWLDAADPELAALRAAAAPAAAHDSEHPHADRVDWHLVHHRKLPLLRKAARALLAARGEARFPQADWDSFLARESHWLAAWAEYAAEKEARGGTAWWEWDGRSARLASEAAVDLERALQFLFDRQFSRLHGAAHARGIELVGDLPIFVAADSADVWQHRELFLLDEGGQPSLRAGVPPDAFAEKGQLWGNPIYNWDACKAQGFLWWRQRVRTLLRRVDRIRMDHFRGFAACWAIPKEAEDARGGAWTPGPGRALFDALAEDLRAWDPPRFGAGPLPLIAEDLGVITPDVEALRDGLQLPGMRILQFAFSGDPRHPYLPANHPTRCVAFSGTHDNETLRGWWEGLDGEMHKRVRAMLHVDGREVPWQIMERLAASRAELCVFPAQDVAGLGNGARMNVPGTVLGNWGWRMRPRDLGEAQAHRLLALVRRCARQPRHAAANDALVAARSPA
jgi:4-alpha-glucanotransferase